MTIMTNMTKMSSFKIRDTLWELFRKDDCVKYCDVNMLAIFHYQSGLDWQFAANSCKFSLKTGLLIICQEL